MYCSKDVNGGRIIAEKLHMSETLERILNEKQTVVVETVAETVAETGYFIVIRDMLSPLEQGTYDLAVRYYEEGGFDDWINRVDVKKYMIEEGVEGVDDIDDDFVNSRLQKIITPRTKTSKTITSGLAFKKVGGNWLMKIY